MTRQDHGRAPATASPDRRGDPAAVVGDTVVVGSLRRDRLGEVCAGRAADGASVRIRFCETEDVAGLAERLVRLGTVRSPTVAPVLDKLTDQRRRVAVISPADTLTLADRRRFGALDAGTAVALGATLLEGLAALHAAGIAHGCADASAVGIDAGGRPRWQDAAIAPPAADGGEAGDVAGLAAALRDAGGLPASLALLVDEVASGMPTAPRSVAVMAARWRGLAERESYALPPAQRSVELAALLAPGRRARPRRLPSAAPAWLRRATAALLAAAAVAVIPAARLLPGGRAALASLDAYRPSHAGQTLIYHVHQAGGVSQSDTTVSLRVGDFLTVSGVPTLTLELAGTGATAGLPLGLDGTTLRVQGEALLRSVSGGSVRDLREPLRAGTAWTDTRDSGSGFLTTEQRTLLGASPLDEPAGHFEQCAVVHLEAGAVASAAPSSGQAATATLWYCPGVGLAHAVLAGGGETDSVDLVASR